MNPKETIAGLDTQILSLVQKIIRQQSELARRIRSSKKGGVSQLGIEISNTAGEIRGLTLARALIIENS